LRGFATINKLAYVALPIGALVFCFAGQALAGWSGPAASSFALETLSPVISIKDNKKHHEGKNQKAKNKNHKDHDDDGQEQTNETSKGNATTPGSSSKCDGNENVLIGDYCQ
jgi:hypothetical protein